MRRRGIRIISIIASAALVSGVTAGRANADPPTTVQSGAWQALADQVYANGSAAYGRQVAAGNNVPAFHVAALAWYAGQRFGWQDSRTQTWLQRVYDRVTASGGYGLGYAYDAYGDGTTNPANTTYTITTAWHVGRLLIAGYDGGGIPASRVLAAVTAILDTPSADTSQCVSYSKYPYDAGKPCVWNVSAAAAWFLWRADQRGIVPAGREDEILTKLRTWRDYVRAHYSTALGGWTYQDNTTALDDPGHLAATVSAMYELDPTIGVTALPAYFSHYATAVSAVDVLIYDCSKVDADYNGVNSYARAVSGLSDADIVAKSAYAPVALRVQTSCD
jgi:hypothetical protein